ncbi:MAG: plasmid pRiA4b ORF-3 family protein [Lachnospiraceae bacterium]|nr:plasmid pRiA4b ORF-3 family protein [Lachnospiraceae bacterium]
MGAYQLKITIKDSHPPIWRRVLVPMQISFENLHEIIQEVFGWTNSHLAVFEVDGCWLECHQPVSPGGDDEEDDYSDGDTRDALEGWIGEGDTFRYIYDFGDDWTHVIKVEKIVEYDKRYPTVIKSKGPNMLEDCGGIWGFEEMREEAPAFDREQVNALLSSRDLPLVESSARDRLPRWDEMDWDEEEDGMVDTDWLHVDDDMLPDEMLLVKQMRDSLGDISSLVDVYREYTKETLKTIAQIMHLNGSSYYKKAELIPWLRDQLLEEDHLRRVILGLHPKEKALFEQMMEVGGGILPEELVSESAFLCAYGAFTLVDEEMGFYQIPLDVQAAWNKVMTEEFAQEWKYKTEFRYYCEGAVFLYGVLPVEKMLELYNHFEPKSMSEAEICMELLELSARGDSVTCTGAFVMDRKWEENDRYYDLLERQGDRKFYVPSTKQEMLSYGEYGFQPLDETTEWFVEYMETELDMNSVEAIYLFGLLQIVLRESEDTQVGIRVLKDFGCRMNSQKTKRTKDMLLKLSRQLRRPELRGFTLAEAYRPIGK